MLAGLLDLEHRALIVCGRFFPLHERIAPVVMHDATQPAAIVLGGLARRLLATRSVLRMVHGLRLIGVGPLPTCAHRTLGTRYLPRPPSRFSSRARRLHRLEVGGPN